MREKKAREVFLMIRRLNKHNKRQKKNVNSNIIRKPAGDNWF
nr:MAG TPA: hypothetical protein [Caudoviricetes sp.]